MTNSKVRNLATMLAITMANDPIRPIDNKCMQKNNATYLRKKCKSCYKFLVYGCQIKAYRKQNDVACSEYKHK